MSVINKQTFAGIIITVAAITGAALFSHSQPQPQSNLYEKIVKTKKLQAPLNINIEMNEDKTVEPNTIYTLDARIKTEKQFPNVQIIWKAPKDVVFLDSETFSTQISANEPLNLSMRFRQNDNKNKKIRFYVKDLDSGYIIGRGMYNTTRQRALANATKELLERQEEYLEKNPDVIKEIGRRHSH